MFGNKKRRKKSKGFSLRQETIHSVVAVLLIMMGVLIMVSFTGQGELLSFINTFLARKIGFSTLLLPFVFISAGLVMFKTKWAWSKPNVFLGTLVITTAVCGLFQTGEIGDLTFLNLSFLMSEAGAYVFFIALFLIGILILSQSSLGELIDWWIKNRKEKLKKAKEKEKEQAAFVTEATNPEEIKKAKNFSLPKLGFSFGKKTETEIVPDQGREMPQESTQGTAVVGGAVVASQKSEDGMVIDDGLTQSNTPIVWEYPPLSLLSDKPGGKANRGDVRKNAQIIENTLESFGITARVAEVNYGPSVTQYALEITKGTRLAKITALSNDLALALAAPTGQIRIEAPIVGRSLVGIEVPNYSAEYVTLREMLAMKEFKNHPSKLAVSLGIDVAGKPVIGDISSMPHVLIAGATGSGKSVAINSFLCSILFRASPSEVKFILVDPKRVELTGYNDIPHLLTPVIVEPSKVVSALKWATNLMDKRYKQLAEVGVKNIAGYNELAGIAAMPSVVIVIDELADIMLFSPAEVEESITRIAQMARAVGIHLVLATQRPSVDVITGLIKANVPTRIAFNVSSMTDSRVVLDSPGAEKLLGKGDMLFVPPDQAKPRRVQGTYVSEKEAKTLIDFLKSQGQKPEYTEEITTKYKAGVLTGGSGGAGGGSGAGGAGEGHDDKFIEAARLFSKYDKASSSLIQRRLAVGYARAARILDQLYEAGFVGAPDGSKPREVNNAKIQEFLSGLVEE